MKRFMGTSKNLLWNSGVDIFFRYEALKTSLTGLSERQRAKRTSTLGVYFSNEVAVKKIKPETE